MSWEKGKLRNMLEKQLIKTLQRSGDPSSCRSCEEEEELRHRFRYQSSTCIVKYTLYSSTEVNLTGRVHTASSATNQLCNPLGSFSDRNERSDVSDRRSRWLRKYSSDSRNGSLILGVTGSLGASADQRSPSAAVIAHNKRQGRSSEGRDFFSLSSEGWKQRLSCEHVLDSVSEWTVSVVGGTRSARNAENELISEGDVKLDRGFHPMPEFLIQLLSSLCNSQMSRDVCRWSHPLIRYRREWNTKFIGSRVTQVFERLK